MNNKDFDAIRIILAEATNLKPGDAVEINCPYPACDGMMRVSRNKENGHKWAVCTKCGVQLSE